MRAESARISYNFRLKTQSTKAGNQFRLTTKFSRTISNGGNGISSFRVTKGALLLWKMKQQKRFFTVQIRPISFCVKLFFFLFSESAKRTGFKKGADVLSYLLSLFYSQAHWTLMMLTWNYSFPLWSFIRILETSWNLLLHLIITTNLNM